MGKSMLWFWISHKLKNISFQQVTGFEKMTAGNCQEMWELVYSFIEQGYRVR